MSEAWIAGRIEAMRPALNVVRLALARRWRQTVDTLEDHVVDFEAATATSAAASAAGPVARPLGEMLDALHATLARLRGL